MSVLETVKSALSPAKLNASARLAPQISERLLQAKARLVDIVREHDAVALRSVETDDLGILREWSGRKDEASRMVSDLEGAHREAMRRDEETAAQEATRRQETAIRSATQKLASCAKKIQALRAAAENYSGAYFAAFKLLAEAKATCQASGLAWTGDHYMTPTRPPTDEERRRGMSYGLGEPVFQRGTEADDYSWASERRFREAVEIELLRVGHGEMVGGFLFPRAVPGSANSGAVTARLKIDPGFHGPLDRDRGLHSEWGKLDGKSELFAALAPLDVAFEKMRAHIMARVKGTMPSETIAPAAPPAELFIGTSSPTFDLGPPLVDTKSLVPIPTTTPHGEPAVGVDPKVKLMAETPVVATLGIESWDAFCEKKYGVTHWHIPRERWAEYVADCDAARVAGEIPGGDNA